MRVKGVLIKIVILMIIIHIFCRRTSWAGSVFGDFSLFPILLIVEVLLSDQVDFSAFSPGSRMRRSECV